MIQTIEIERAVEAYLSGSRFDSMTDNEVRNRAREDLRDVLDGRFFVDRFPQTVKPGALIMNTGNIRGYHIEGEDCDVQAIVEVVCYAQRGEVIQSAAIWDFVRLAMSGYDGQWIYDSITVNVHGCTVQPASEGRRKAIKPIHGDDKWLAGFGGSFRVTYGQQVP